MFYSNFERKYCKAVYYKAIIILFISPTLKYVPPSNKRPLISAAPNTFRN